MTGINVYANYPPAWSPDYQAGSGQGPGHTLKNVQTTNHQSPKAKAYHEKKNRTEGERELLQIVKPRLWTDYVFLLHKKWVCDFLHNSVSQSCHVFFCINVDFFVQDACTMHPLRPSMPSWILELVCVCSSTFHYKKTGRTQQWADTLPLIVRLQVVGP